jgi:flagellar biosynthesis/type III secretory pathway ATPase
MTTPLCYHRIDTTGFEFFQRQTWTQTFDVGVLPTDGFVSCGAGLDADFEFFFSGRQTC